MSADTCTITRQHQPEQEDIGNIRPCRKHECSRHEERRLSVATRQIALSSRNGTARVTPNFAAGMQTNCTNPNTYQPCFSARSVLSLAVGVFFRYRTLAVEKKTIRTPAKTPPTNSTPLEMLAPKSHTSLAKMESRRMKEGAMWMIGYVDTVNLRSHMPTMKIRQPPSGL